MPVNYIFTNRVYLTYILKQDLALGNLQELICRKIQLTSFCLFAVNLNRIPFDLSSPKRHETTIRIKILFEGILIDWYSNHWTIQTGGVFIIFINEYLNIYVLVKKTFKSLTNPENNISLNSYCMDTNLFSHKPSQ